MTYTYIHHIPSPPLNAYIDGLFYLEGPMPLSRLGFEDLLWITHDHPANGKGWLTAVKPDRRPGCDFDVTFFLSIPVLYFQAFPASALVSGDFFQGR